MFCKYYCIREEHPPVLVLSMIMKLKEGFIFASTSTYIEYIYTRVVLYVEQTVLVS